MPNLNLIECRFNFNFAGPKFYSSRGKQTNKKFKFLLSEIARKIFQSFHLSPLSLSLSQMLARAFFRVEEKEGCTQTSVERERERQKNVKFI
jgi:hypothetical protein